METKRPTAAIKLGENKAKFLIGEAIDGQVAILYYDEADCSNAIKDGQILDEDKVAKALTYFHHLVDEELSLKVSTDSVALVYPPIGLEIYQSHRSCTCVGERVEPIDISNVMSLVNKEKVPNNNQIVDIVPDFFTLDNGAHYKNPPLGEKSNSLAIQTKVYTLPRVLISSYSRCLSKADYLISRSEVGPYLAAQLLFADKEMPRECFYCDIGANLTTLSLFSNGSPIKSLTFRNAGNDIDKAISSGLGIDLEIAKALKEAYGYSPITNSYQAPIYEGFGENNVSKTIYQKNLNEVLEAHFKDFASYLSNAIASIIENIPISDNAAKEALKVLPIVLSGGSSQLNGIEKLLDLARGNHTLIKYIPKVPGANDPSLVELLGMVLVSSTYKGSLADDYHRVSSLNRGGK